MSTCVAMLVICDFCSLRLLRPFFQVKYTSNLWLEIHPDHFLGLLSLLSSVNTFLLLWILFFLMNKKLDKTDTILCYKTKKFGCSCRSWLRRSNQDLQLEPNFKHFIKILIFYICLSGILTFLPIDSKCIVQGKNKWNQ